MAILPWGHVIEDFLEPEGMSLDEFATEFRGSWMFGYAEALASAGVGTAVVVVSAREERPLRRRHAPSGATISVLPAPAPFTALRRRARNLYARSGAEAFGSGSEGGRDPRFAPGGPPQRFARALARETAPYLATPPRALARELRALGADVLLSQEYESPQFDLAVAAGALARIPAAASFQGGDYHRYRVERLVRPVTIRRASRLIVPTESEAARVRERYGVPAGRIARIFNPVDTRVWRPAEGSGIRTSVGIPARAPLAVWHGRVSIGQKGLDVLMEAWRIVERDWTGPNRPHLLLVGHGRDSASVDALVGELGLENVTRVPRLVHDPAELAGLLAAADLYVLPSRHEGFPVALVEALACGLPAVAADANGVADILEDGERSGGVIVPREDPAALAAEAGALLGDGDRLAALGAAARESAERRFSHRAIGRMLREALVPQAAR